VAHVTGHAVLDALRPEYGDDPSLQSSAIHEAFADLTIVLAKLAQMSQCEAIITASRGTLHTSVLAPHLAFPYVAARHGCTYVPPRATSPEPWRPETQSVAEQAQVLTGAVCDILVDFYQDYCLPHLYDPAESLFRVGKHVTGLLLEAWLSAPSIGVTIRDIAEQLRACEPIPAWRKLIESQFAERRVWDVDAATLARLPEPKDWHGCCATLQPQQAVPKGKS
jgi:hypothetical protein